MQESVLHYILALWFGFASFTPLKSATCQRDSYLYFVKVSSGIPTIPFWAGSWVRQEPTDLLVLSELRVILAVSVPTGRGVVTPQEQPHRKVGEASAMQ